jgi:GNAT superfamily N-acetyltransferase
VRAWQHAYRGIFPDEYLRSLSIEQRTLVWRQLIASHESSMWVAHDGDQMLGWISAAASRDPDASPSTGEIRAVYINPAHWRKGVGRLLCDHAEQYLQGQGFLDATLWVLEQNDRALKFYGSRGYAVEHGKKESVRAGETIPEIRLRKRLVEPLR